MSRDRINDRIDIRVIAALKERNVSAEAILLEALIFKGWLPKETSPLGSLRGGTRPGAGRPKGVYNDNN